MSVVKELLATVGANELLYNGVKYGMLPTDVDLKRVDEWGDEENQQVIVESEDEPRRLVYDEILGWQWYNSEGPEE